MVNRRQQATSALLFGMVALLTKPGQTFAPLIGTWLLCVYTGTDGSTESEACAVTSILLLLQVSVVFYNKFISFDFFFSSNLKRKQTNFF